MKFAHLLAVASLSACIPPSFPERTEDSVADAASLTITADVVLATRHPSDADAGRTADENTNEGRVQDGGTYDSAPDVQDDDAFVAVQDSAPDAVADVVTPDDTLDATSVDATGDVVTSDDSAPQWDSGICLHDDGIASQYNDCANPPGTMNFDLAFEACISDVGQPPTQCAAQTLGQDSVVCASDNAQRCVCWSYAGPGAGHLRTATDATCVEPTTTDPSWN